MRPSLLAERSECTTPAIRRSQKIETMLSNYLEEKLPQIVEQLDGSVTVN